MINPRGEAAGALAGLMGGMGGAAGPAPGESPDLGGAEGQNTDLEGALAQVEMVLEGMSPDVAESAREHLNAIRDLASSEQPEEPAGPMPEGPSEMAPETEDDGGGALPPPMP